MAKAKVRYKGLSDERIITKKDLAGVNIRVDGDLVFNRRNAFSMIINLNDELEQVLKNEGTFTVSELKDDNTEGMKVITADSSLADESQHDGAVTHDTVNKQTTAKGK